MQVLNDIAAYLINSFAGLFFWAVILRFLLQLARADFYNPVSQGLVRLTNPLLKPMRRFIPGMFGLDIAALVLAMLIKAATLFLLLLLDHKTTYSIYLLIWPAIYILVTILNIYYVAIFASIITSFVAQGSHHPFVILTQQIAEPIMAPCRKLLPPMGGLDFSPMIVLAALYVVRILLSALAANFGLMPGSL
ncbi:MAG TPA: YggT family protein, partial [Spongiibacteraceae bacterium]|nr:YggT family protein [Spongiibacteraceae bacterium]